MKKAFFEGTCQLARAVNLFALCLIGESLAQEPEKPKPELLRVKVEQGKEREIVIEETVPIFREKGHQEEDLVDELLSKRSENEETGRFEVPAVKKNLGYVLLATVFEGGVTRLSWNATSGGRDTKFEAWSGYDWSAMYGFQLVEDEEARYSFLLHIQHASEEDQRSYARKVERLRKRVSSLRKGSRPLYQLRNSKKLSPGRRKEAREFLQAVHRFIGSNQKRIRLTHEARKRAREEERLRKITDRGKRKAPVTVRFSRVYRKDEKADQEKGGTR